MSFTGPAAIAINPFVVPARAMYRLTMVYQGPPLADPNPFVAARWSLRVAPPLFQAPGADRLVEGNNFDCEQIPPPMPSISCTATFTNAARTTAIDIGMMPTGNPGTATISAEVATGATTSWTTVITRETPPPPPPPPPPPFTPPAPIPGPPAAPTRTVTTRLDDPGDTTPVSAPISSAAETVQVALTWPDIDASFDATGFRLVATNSPTRALAAADNARVKLRVRKRRSSRALDVRITGVKRGRLVFRIVAKRVYGPTRVTAKIRQSKR